MRVRITFEANAPMKWGLLVAVVGILVLFTHWAVLPDVDALSPTALAFMITGAVIYMIGRTMQIWKKRV
jgi:hypothetical protein